MTAKPFRIMKCRTGHKIAASCPDGSDKEPNVAGSQHVESGFEGIHSKSTRAGCILIPLIAIGLWASFIALSSIIVLALGY